MITREFKNLTKNDVNIAGGKGASLGEMTRAGIPVPPGFVVLSEAFDKFLEMAKLGTSINKLVTGLKEKDTKEVEKVSEKIRQLIEKASFPKEIAQEIESEFKKLSSPLVAVRSSATAEDSANASWAGELESYLNTTAKTLLENVKHCWASLFTPRALVYRAEHGLLDARVSVAVVVQKMVQSEVSGICFTVHPVTNDRSQMIIEAGWGLGEAIVGGMITPDSYVIQKTKNSDQGTVLIDQKNISNQEKMIVRGKSVGTEWKKVPEEKQEAQKLSDEKLSELSKLCLKIEQHYGFPCDIEWAVEKGIIYIVQSRPITTL